MLNFITIIYLVERQLIAPPNRVNKYLSVLRLLIKLSLNAASLAPVKA